MEQPEIVYSLGEVVVQGKMGGVESVSTVYRVTEEDISISGARNLNEAMDLLPGVNVMVGGDAVPKIDIRGFRPRHNILLLDGIPINSTYDQQFNPSIIPVEHIAEIKMTTGASSVLYGQGGLGGVINIITKKGFQGLHGMVGSEAGQGDSYLGKGSISGGDEKFNFFLSASSTRRNHFPLSDDFEDTPLESGQNRENSDKENSNFFANVGYDAGKDLRLGLTFNYLLGEYGLPVVVYDSATDAFAPNKKFERMDDFEGFSLQVAGDYHPGDSPLSVRGWAYYNQMDEEHNRYCSDQYDGFTCDPLLKTFNLDDTVTVKGLSLQPKVDFREAGVLTFGLSAQQDTWESKGQAWTEWSSAWPPGYLLEDVDDDKDTEVYSGALQYEYTPLPGLGLVFGYARYYQERDDPAGSGDIDQGGHILPATDDSDHDNSIMAGAYYDITHTTRLKTAFQRNVRFPSIRQLYDEDSGNPALKTERVYHYTAGIEQKLPGNIRLTIDGYRSIANDFIEKDSRRSEQFQNFDKYLFTGVELTADICTFRNLVLRTSYSFLHTKDKADTGRDELQYRPEHRIAVEGRYNFDCGFTPYISLLYVANQFYYERGGNPWDPPAKAELDDYTVINLKLNQKLSRDKGMLYLGADNIFDEDYQQSYGYPLSGRFIYGGIEVEF